MSGPVHAEAIIERWALATPFIISRERFDDVAVVLVTLDDGRHRGRGECCPVGHYGETPQSVLAQVELMLAALRKGADWAAIHDDFPPGAARNAVDCAVWDLRARQQETPVWAMLGLPRPAPVETVFTISMGPPDSMAAAARRAEGHAILKLKLGGADDGARVAAIRAAVPDKRLIADINEAWSPANLAANLPAMVAAGIEMVEQPFPASMDAPLADFAHPLPIGADESCHVAADVAGLVGRYDLVNIKLDKTGGLTEAVRLLHSAQAAGLDAMVGCMLGTSLAMAPAMLLAPACRFVDLDAPLLMGCDRAPALAYRGGWVDPPAPGLWG
ncbi:MAG: dipeptide epimerase [Sphingomonas sp. SCN 67-18]|uniref:N-acetyl-D-Glu racemase DgcA n=1 Tax=uncultured Sphingomonas sp. TaxID=158754 RepID=UPI0008688613|nr:N-acetyl-D-Glu racemase DgcA [Sphingomonas sp. SCN 67-18]ODU21613.1 MAG: dipeptide epimerase [Sphingomonas sp. SCN 67-18]